MCIACLRCEPGAGAPGAGLWLLADVTVKQASPFEAGKSGESTWGGVTRCRNVTARILPACVYIAWQVVRFCCSLHQGGSLHPACVLQAKWLHASCWVPSCSVRQRQAQARRHHHHLHPTAKQCLGHLASHYTRLLGIAPY